MEPAELLVLDSSARTDVGAVHRALNQTEEDTALEARFRDARDPGGVRALFAVADGLGTARGGKVASAQALNMLEEGVEHYARRGESGIPGLAGLEAFLLYAVDRIDVTLKQSSENNPNLGGMGTTLTAVVVDGNTARLIHAGDSRAYVLREGGTEFQQLTSDDAALVEGEWRPVNGLGGVAEQVQPALSAEPLHAGDVLLLCTDGLWREVDDAIMHRILAGSPTPAIASDRLVRAANHSGGRGNIGVVVVHVGRPDIPNDAELDRLFPRPGAARRDPGTVPMPLASARPVTGGPASPPRPAAPAAPTEGALGPPQPLTGQLPPGPATPARVIPPPGTSDPSDVAQGTTGPSGVPRRDAAPPAAQDVDPRSIPPRPPLPGVQASPFMAAVGGFAAGVVFLAIVWGVSAKMHNRATSKASAPAQTQDVAVFYFPKSDAPLTLPDVWARGASAEPGQEWAKLGKGENTLGCEVDPEPGEPLVELRANAKVDAQGRVKPTQFVVKIGRVGTGGAAAPVRTTSAAGVVPAVSAPGTINVRSATAGRITVTREGEREPLQEADLELDPAGDCSAMVTQLPLGRYVVFHTILRQSRLVTITTEQPSQPVRFPEADT